MKITYYNLDKRELVQLPNFSGIVTKSLSYAAGDKGPRWNLAQPNERATKQDLSRMVGVQLLLCNSETYPASHIEYVGKEYVGRWHGDRITVFAVGKDNSNASRPTYSSKFSDITSSIKRVGRNHLMQEEILKEKGK
jgi:hypothetical protein